MDIYFTSRSNWKIVTGPSCGGIVSGLIEGKASSILIRAHRNFQQH